MAPPLRFKCTQPFECAHTAAHPTNKRPTCAYLDGDRQVYRSSNASHHLGQLCGLFEERCTQPTFGGLCVLVVVVMCGRWCSVESGLIRPRGVGVSRVHALQPAPRLTRNECCHYISFSPLTLHVHSPWMGQPQLMSNHEAPAATHIYKHTAPHVELRVAGEYLNCSHS